MQFPVLAPTSVQAKNESAPPFIAVRMAGRILVFCAFISCTSSEKFIEGKEYADWNVLLTKILTIHFTFLEGDNLHWMFFPS